MSGTVCGVSKATSAQLTSYWHLLCSLDSRALPVPLYEPRGTRCCSYCVLSLQPSCRLVVCAALPELAAILTCAVC